MTKLNTYSRLAKTSILFALLALCAAIVSAQPPGSEDGSQRGKHRGPGHLEQFDANGDGEITRDEFDSIDHFDRLDRNGDGVLNQEDAPERGDRMRRRGRSPESMIGMMLAFRADADENRVTSADEWSAFVAGLDADFNGEIDAEEMFAAFAPQQDDRRSDREPGEERFERLSEILDVNENGVLEVAEIDELFTGLDEDGDGEVKIERRRRGPRGDRGPRG